MKVTTETGSVYEITDFHVRRIGTHNMRRDGEWIKLRTAPDPIVGQPMVLLVEQLGDTGFPFTTRITSHVTGITP